jgi:homocysteine S-methyltransferase
MSASTPGKGFFISIEVVPPAGPDAGPLLASLAALGDLAVDAFSVATNPVAKPRMSALALCTLIERDTGRKAILHCTTRDHNRLSLQGLLWGARALGIASVLVTTGDFVALGDRATTSDVRDIDIFGLLQLACEAGLQAGVVLDPRPETGGLARAVDRLKRKVAAGASFVVTQPVYDATLADALATAIGDMEIPLVMGILPLRTPRHADFLHTKVAGIDVPQPVRERMHRAADPTAEGIAIARENLALARERFAGACIMPPFDHYEVMPAILSP